MTAVLKRYSSSCLEMILNFIEMIICICKFNETSIFEHLIGLVWQHFRRNVILYCFVEPNKWRGLLLSNIIEVLFFIC